MVTLIEKYQDPELNNRYSEMEKLKEQAHDERGDSDSMNEKLMRKINSLFIKGNTDKHKKITRVSDLITNPERKKVFEDYYLQITSTGIGRSQYKDSQIDMFKYYKSSYAPSSFSDMILATPEVYAATFNELKQYNRMVLSDMKEVNDKFLDLKEIKTIQIEENLSNPEKFLVDTFGDGEGNVKISISSNNSFYVNIGNSYGSTIQIDFDREGKDKLYSLMILENHFDQVKTIYNGVMEQQRTLLNQWKNFIKEMDYSLSKYVVFNKI